MSPNLTAEEKIDPRVKRTRAMLVQAFMEVVSERGFQAISVQDITEKAGVNRTTFYLHFADKFSLLDFTIQQMFNEEIGKRLSHAEGLSLGNLRLLIMTVCEFTLQSNAHCSPAEPQFETLAETQVKNRLQEILQGWVERSGSPADAQMAATAASWAIYGLALQWSHDKKRHPSESYAERVLPIIAANLGMAQPV